MQKRYIEEQSEIRKKAEELEKVRDERSEAADHLLHAHHRFAYAVAILQVAIALGAIGALTRSRMIWVLSILAGLSASFLFVLAILR